MAQRWVPCRRGVFRFGVLLAMLAGAAATVRAQATSGVIVGTVRDAQAAVLPGATVTLRNAETGALRTAVSESDGAFRIAGLSPGRYDLRTELPGFAAIEVKALILTIGLELRHDVTLSLAGVEESVMVTAQAPVIETTRNEVSAVVTQQQIEALPIEGRQPLGLALLMPGTTQDSMRVRRFNTDVGAAAGLRGATSYYVDGGMNWSGNAGEPRLDFPQAAVREFKVNVSQASAEFGGTTGGVVTIVTKSGTNTLHGEAFEFFRDTALNAMNRFEQQAHDERGVGKPEFRRHQYGVAVGGPVVKDRAHYFIDIEQTRQRTAFVVNTGKPEFYSPLEGTFPNEYKSNILFGRGDMQIGRNQNVFVRYAYMGETNFCEDCGGNNAAFSTQGSYTPRDSMVAGHTWVVSSRAVNEIRVQGPPAKLRLTTQPPGTPVWNQRGTFTPERDQGRTAVYNFPSLSWGSSADTFNTTRQWDFREDFSITFGRHAVKVGGAFLNIRSYEDVPDTHLGMWTFATDQFFDGTPASMAALKTPIQFTASFPQLTRELTNRWWQLYVQDEWRPLAGLTLNLGVRYDLQEGAFNQGLDQSMYPRPLPNVDFKSRGDTNNVAPRLGFAWDLKNSGRSVLRGGYGKYYMYVQMSALRGEITTLRQTSITIRNPAYPDPYGGRSPASFASTSPPNIQTVANDLRNPYAHTGNLGLSQELMRDLAVHVDAVYTRMLDMTRTANINTPVPATAVRPDPTWGRIVQTQSGAVQKYRALFVRLEKRYSTRHQYLVSYTLAKSDGDYVGTSTNGTVTDFYNPGLDFGPGTTDRRHTLVLSGSVLLPFDVTLGGVWTLRSTMPFSALAGEDLNNDGSITDYVPGTSRSQGNRHLDLGLVNTWRAVKGRKPIAEDQIDSSRYNSINVRASKSVLLPGGRKVELIAQVFDIAGTVNLLPAGGGFVTNALSDSFGRILTAQNSRQAELAVRFAW